MAAAMVSSLMSSNISRAAKDSIVTHSQTLVGEALSGIAQVQFLARTDAADVGRVEALVAVDGHELTDLGQRVDVEEPAGHECLAAGEGFA